MRNLACVRFVATAIVCLAVSPTAAQELEPALYANAPVNVNLAVASYGFSAGNVLVSAGGELQHNGRMGATLALPVSAQTSLKITYVNGLVTRLGGDFDSLGTAVQRSWR